MKTSEIENSIFKEVNKLSIDEGSTAANNSIKPTIYNDQDNTSIFNSFNKQRSSQDMQNRKTFTQMVPFDKKSMVR